MLMTVCCSPDGSLVFDSSADALRYLDVLCVTIVSGLTALLHCFQAAHASVLFYPCAIAGEVLTCRHSYRLLVSTASQHGCLQCGLRQTGTLVFHHWSTHACSKESLAAQQRA